MMNNPKTAAYFNKIEGVTSSVLDMDQERHNLPWSGSVTASASMIQWQKSDGSTLIPGSSWKLYRTLDDAQKQQNPITTVTDNGTGDWNPTGGIISVTSLVPNKNYYIRENGHMQGYEPNNNIYLIQTTNTGDTLNTTIAKVWNEKGGNITGTADAALTTGGAIINTPEDQGTNIEWGKYAAGDTAHTPLPGSSWDFSSDGGTTWTEITDVTDSVTGIVIKNAQGADVTNTNIGTVQTPSTLKFTASVTPTGAPRGIIWTSSNAAMAVVEPDGTVNVRDGDGSTVVTLTATSTSDPTIKATVSFTPSLPDVSSIEIFKAGETQLVTELSMNVGNEVKLEADVQPQGIAASWTASNSNVTLTTNSDGTVTVTGVATGTSVVTAKAGTKQAQVTVTVQEDQTRTAVYILWSGVDSVTFKVDGQDPAIQTQKVASCSENWFVGYVYKNRQQFTIGDIKSNTGAQYNVTSGTPTVSAGEPSWKIEGGKGSQGAPSCAAQRDVSNPNGPSVFADDVVVADEASAASALPEVHAEGDSNAAQSSALQDVDSNPGRFKLENLPNGTYKLKEHTAPDGFTLNTQMYTITIADGQNGQKVVTWDPNHVDANGVAWISDKPTQVYWEKVDSDNDNAPLAGSGWTIEQKSIVEGKEKWAPINEVLDCTKAPCNASVTYKDEDPAPGKFLVKKLPVGEYRISETTVPDGYETPKDANGDPVYHPFEITPDGEETVLASPKPLGNKRTTGTVNWKKVSSEDSAASKTPLAGSEWQLTYTSYDKITNSDDTTTPKETIICQLTDTGSSCTVNGESKNVAWAVDQDSDNGEFSYAKLPWGDYVIVETKAPDGYNLDTTEHRFTIGLGSTEENKFEVSLGDIENTPGVVLPATGGEGNTLIVLFGFALIAISMVGCGVAMRKRI